MAHTTDSSAPIEPFFIPFPTDKQPSPYWDVYHLPRSKATLLKYQADGKLDVRNLKGRTGVLRDEARRWCIEQATPAGVMLAHTAAALSSQKRKAHDKKRKADAAAKKIGGRA